MVRDFSPFDMPLKELVGKALDLAGKADKKIQVPPSFSLSLCCLLFLFILIHILCSEAANNTTIDEIKNETTKQTLMLEK